jgi:hypothetical protein
MYVGKIIILVTFGGWEDIGENEIIKCRVESPDSP